jgi:hypothetical protein
MRIRLALVPIIAAAALVAGCTQGAAPTPPAAGNGVAAMSAEEILTKAQDALAEAGSFQAKGSMKQDGEDITIDMVVNGDDTKSTILASGQTIEAVMIGNEVYVKLPEMFLTIIAAGNPAAATLAKDKFLKLPANDPRLDAFSGFANLKDELLGADASAAGATKGEAKTINGTPAIGVKVAEGTLYVATEGKPYPLRLEPADGTGGVDFSNFGSAPAVEAPPADQVLDISTLMP